MREIGYTKSDKLYDYPDLLPCPFCGKRPEMVVNPHRKQETFFVKCMNKKCDIQPLTDEYKDILKAAKKWNIRSESDVRLPAADVAPVHHGHWINENFYTRCSVCGKMAIYDKYGQEVESDYCPNCGAKMEG